MPHRHRTRSLWQAYAVLPAVSDVAVWTAGCSQKDLRVVQHTCILCMVRHAPGLLILVASCRNPSMPQCHSRCGKTPAWMFGLLPFLVSVRTGRVDLAATKLGGDSAQSFTRIANALVVTAFPRPHRAVQARMLQIITLIISMVHCKYLPFPNPP